MPCVPKPVLCSGTAPPISAAPGVSPAAMTCRHQTQRTQSGACKWLSSGRQQQQQQTDSARRMAVCVHVLQLECYMQQPRRATAVQALWQQTACQVSLCLPHLDGLQETAQLSLAHPSLASCQGTTRPALLVSAHVHRSHNHTAPLVRVSFTHAFSGPWHQRRERDL